MSDEADVVDYGEIERILLDVALGRGESKPKSVTQTRTSHDERGNKTVTAAVKGVP